MSYIVSTESKSKSLLIQPYVLSLKGGGLRNSKLQINQSVYFCHCFKGLLVFRPFVSTIKLWCPKMGVLSGVNRN